MGSPAVAASGPVYVLCSKSPKRELPQRIRERPRSCNVFLSSQSFGYSARLSRLQWHHWGASRATATARELNTRLRVRVVAWRLRRDCDGDIVYSRVRVQGGDGVRRGGVITWSLSPC
jgi:hypothetical protein